MTRTTRTAEPILFVIDQMPLIAETEKSGSASSVREAIVCFGFDFDQSFATERGRTCITVVPSRQELVHPEILSLSLSPRRSERF